MFLRRGAEIAGGLHEIPGGRGEEVGLGGQAELRVRPQKGFDKVFIFFRFGGAGNVEQAAPRF